MSYYYFLCIQGALLLYAALALHSIPGALLLRPPEFFTQARPTKPRKSRVGRKPHPVYADSATQTSCERGIQTALMLDTEPWFSDLTQVDQSTQADIPITLTRSLSLDQQSYQAALLCIGAAGSSQPNIPRAASTLLLRKRGSVYSSRASLYHAPLQDTIIPTEQQPLDEPSAPPPPKPTVGLFIRTFARNLFDKDVLRNPLFWMFAAATSFGHCGYMNALMFLPPYSVELFGAATGKATASLLLSVMGVSDLVGRVGGGLFADTGLIRRTWLCGFCYLLSGLLNVLMPLKPLYGVMIAYALVVGVFGGTYMALLSVIVVDLCGPEKLSAGVGLGTMIMGLFVMPIPSLLGRITLL